MANRNYASGGKIYSMHVEPVMITCAVTIGSTGAVTSFKGPMVKSVTRTATGSYTLAMATSPSVTNFNKVISTQAAMRAPVSGLSGIVATEFQNDPGSAMSSKTAPGISFKTLAISGSAADPASGTVISILIMCDQSSVNTF